MKCCRLEEAKSLLQNTSMSVKEVMCSVGMTDKSHFSRDFRRVYGIAPSRFRSAAGSKNVEAPPLSKLRCERVSPLGYGGVEAAQAHAAGHGAEDLAVVVTALER